MHCIVGVIHDDPELNVDLYFERFLYDNEQFFEISEEHTKEEALEMIEQDIMRLRDMGLNNLDEREKNYLEKLTQGTEEERIRYWADNNWYGPYYQVRDDLSIYVYSNPYAECDWFSIGGRWDKTLIDFKGNTDNTMAIDQINFDNDNCLPCLYAVVRQYDGEDYLDDIDATKSFKEILEKDFDYAEKREKRLYVTLVDMHY